MSNYLFVANLVQGIIDKFMPKLQNISILDLGCGNGDLLHALKNLSQNYSLSGVDIYPAEKDIARLSKYCCANIQRIEPYDDLKFFEKDFDVIICNQVLEHVGDVEKFLEIAFAKLKPHGLFIAGYPTTEVLFESHAGIPLIHRLKSRSTRTILLNIKFTVFKVFRIGKYIPKLAWTARSTYVNSWLTYMDEKLFYRNWKDYKKYFSKLGSLMDVSYMYVDHSRSSRMTDIAKSCISLVPSKSLKNIVARRIFGVYTIAKKTIHS